MNLFVTNLNQQIADLCAAIESLPMPEKVEALNRVRRALHAVSPFQSEPVDCVQWVLAAAVHGNDYNPNKVAPPEMRLLEISIAEDGYTQPIVGYDTGGGYEVVDGFHRTQVGKQSPAIRQRLREYLPVVIINSNRADRKDRMAATIRHNRARGVHGVLPMTNIVAELIRLGWEDSVIAKHLGMDADELLRFKQTTGLTELFKNKPYSRAWE